MATARVTIATAPPAAASIFAVVFRLLPLDLPRMPRRSWWNRSCRQCRLTLKFAGELFDASGSLALGLRRLDLLECLRRAPACRANSPLQVPELRLEQQPGPAAKMVRFAGRFGYPNDSHGSTQIELRRVIAHRIQRQEIEIGFRGLFARRSLVELLQEERRRRRRNRRMFEHTRRADDGALRGSTAR